MNTVEIDMSTQAPKSRDGAVTKLLKKLFLRDGRVTGIEQVSDHFCLITISGADMKSVKWTPGNKIQIMIGDGLSNRTYTPIAWDTETGQTRFLAYLHGDTPACRWVVSMHSDDAVRFLGPRDSLDLPAVASDAVLFGDETSFSLAAALRGIEATQKARCVFEVSNCAQSAIALAAIGISDAILVERLPDESHLENVTAALMQRVSDTTQFVMTGKAGSIQVVKKSLTAAKIGNTRMKAKAYWAPGKIGLD